MKNHFYAICSVLFLVMSGYVFGQVQTARPGSPYTTLTKQPGSCFIDRQGQPYCCQRWEVDEFTNGERTYALDAETYDDLTKKVHSRVDYTDYWCKRGLQMYCGKAIGTPRCAGNKGFLKCKSQDKCMLGGDGSQICTVEVTCQEQKFRIRTRPANDGTRG